MTTNYHTNIATGAPANAAIVNAPDGQLDAAILASNMAIASVSSEVVTARATYSTLDARLNYLTVQAALGGGNAATLTNGAASAGQKVVTVISTTGLIAHARCAYQLVSGAVEYNVIHSVDSPTQITLTTNIGAGGIPTGTYLCLISESEYQAANAVPHSGDITLATAMALVGRHIFNVDAYGASPSASAAANTVAIQAAIDDAAITGWGNVVYVPPVGYDTATTIIVKAGVMLRGTLSGLTRPAWTAGVSATPGGSTFVITDTLAPAFILRSSARIEGFQFYYPSQNWAMVNMAESFVAYPATIQLGDAVETGPTAMAVASCNFLGAFDCINQYATDGTGLELLSLDHIGGWFLGTFLRVNRASDVLYFRDIHLNPNSMTDKVVSSGGDTTTFMTKGAVSNVGFHLGHIDGINASDIFIYGVNTFAHYDGNMYTADPNTGMSGNWVNTAADLCYRMWHIQRGNSNIPFTWVSGWCTPGFRPNGVIGDAVNQCAMLLEGADANNVRITIADIRFYTGTSGPFLTGYVGAAVDYIQGTSVGSNNQVTIVGGQYANNTGKLVGAGAIAFTEYHEMSAGTGVPKSSGLTIVKDQNTGDPLLTIDNPNAGSSARILAEFLRAGVIKAYLDVDNTDKFNIKNSMATSMQIIAAAGGNIKIIYDTVTRIGIDANGIGFLGAAPVARPTVAGAKLPGDAVMASLLSALVALGLVTNSTT